MDLSTLRGLRALLRAARPLGLGVAFLAGAGVQAQAVDPSTGEALPGVRVLPQGLPAEVPSFAGGSDLTLLGRLADGETRGLAVVGNVLYRSNGGYLETLDVANPAAPVVLDRLLFPQGVVYGVAVQGTHAYVAVTRSITNTTRGGLYVVDVTDPANLQTVGQVTGRSFYDVIVSGTLAYTAATSGGLRLYDVSNPAAPAASGVLTVSGGSVLSVALNGTTAYLAAGNAGLRVVDVSNPATPVAQGSLATIGFATDVVYADGKAYVSAQGVGLVVVDVTNPAAPVELGRYLVPGPSNGQIRSLAVGGTTAYLGKNDGVVALDVTNPAAIAVRDSLIFGVTGSAQSVTVAGTRAYVGNRYTGVTVVDVTNPADLTELALVRNGGFSFKVNVVGNIAYVVDLIGQLRLVDISDPVNPVELSRVTDLRNADGVDVEGGIAYVVHRGEFDPPTGRITRIDVSNPAAPAVLGSVVTPWWAYGVDVVGPTVFVATGNNGTTDGGVRAYTPALTLLDEAAAGNQAFDVRVAGNRAYVATFGGGLSILDVTNPADITPLSLNAIGDFAQSLEVSGSVVYMADSQFGGARALSVIDVSNPASPVLLDTGDGLAGGTATDVAYGNSRAYATVDFVGLFPFDVTNPADVLGLPSVVTADRGVGVDAEGDLVVMVDAGAGVWVFRNDVTTANEPAAPEGFRVAAGPNPFRSEASLRYHLPQREAVTLEVFDVTGARVARVEAGAQAAGWHTLPVDGSGWADGVYLYRLTAGGHVATGRLTLAR